VLSWAEELLPEHVHFVGGHPVAGKETSGIDAAEASLCEQRAWAIVPSVRASEQAIRAVESMVTLAGAQPMFLDAAEHDSYLAAVSHLPLVVATALFALASQSNAWPELAALAGPGFRDTTRLASTSPDLSHDICLTNRENLLHWLDRFGEELRRLRALVADGATDEELVRAFAQAQTERDAFLRAPPQRETGAPVDSLSSGERMMSFLVGEYVVRRTKEVQELVDRNRGEGKRS
jgi:prephenate dehydrogenase